MATDQATTGTTADGTLSVTVDGSQRVVGVEVHAIEPVRSASALDDAVAAAYRAALVGDDPAPATLPVARRVRRISAAPRADLLERHQIRYQDTGRRPQPPSAVTGTSVNGCVSVGLGPSGPRGSVTADAGWLAQTSATRLSTAVAEAFHDAYARRDPS